MASSIHASASTTIERDIDDVFAYLSDFSTMDDWVVGVSDTRLVAGSGGNVGDVYEYDYTYSGRTEPMRVEVTVVEKPTRVAMRAREGPFPFEGELTLSDDAGRTRVTNAIEPGSDSRFTTAMFTLFRPLMRWMMRRRLAAELDELKTILESPGERSRTGSPADPDSSTPA